MRIIAAHYRALNTVAFSPDGTQLTVGWEDEAGGFVRIFDVASGQLAHHIPVGKPHSNRIVVAFNHGGDELFVGTGPIHVVRPQSCEWFQVGSSKWIHALAPSRDGSELWVATYGGVDRWDTSRWQSLPALLPPTPGTDPGEFWACVSLATSSCGTRIALGRRITSYTERKDRNAVFVFDPVSGVASFTAYWFGHRPTRLAFHPGGTLLAAACGSVLRVWNLDSRAEIAALKPGPRPFTATTFSPCGRYLGATSEDHTTRLWPVNAWAGLKTLDWGIGKIYDLAYSPDGTLCAVASESGKILLFDVD